MVNSAPERSGAAAASIEHVDVLIVGAGLSGIGAACRLRQRCPNHSLAILEARDAIGGTWDLFRYPGVRSDSDMHTLGYGFRPWTGARAIADGATILDYIRATAADMGVENLVRYRHKVVAAHWCSRAACWTVDIIRGSDEIVTRLTCGFLYLGSGYYDYDAGHAPNWPGLDSFAGRVVHPQFWPQDLDVADKNVVVIGSGATAVTLVPALAARGARVTMLQRSPSYVVSRPSRDGAADRLARILPAGVASGVVRWKNILAGLAFYTLARRRPQAIRRRLIAMVRQELGSDYDIGCHFTPRYDPWDQRLCLVPDGDLFRALRAGQARIVTDTIESMSTTGIYVRSQDFLPADIIVSATGLQLKMAGDIRLSVDDTPVDLADTIGYRGMMFGGVPNLAWAFGYTNASWTLKSDLTALYVCRLLNHMTRIGATRCVASLPTDVTPRPWLDFTSGYVQRAAAMLPRQGDRAPWRLHQNYLRDLLVLRCTRLEDGVMTFDTPSARQATPH